MHIRFRLTTTFTMSRLLCILLLSLSALTLASDVNSDQARVGKRPSSGAERTSENQRNGRRGTVGAFEVIEAEDYSNCTAGISTLNRDGNILVQFIRDGYSIGYFDVDFGSGANRVEFRVLELTGECAGKNGMIYLHVGSLTHTPIAAVTIGCTTGVNKYVTLSQYLDMVPKDVLDLYLTFTTEYSDYYLIDIDYFQFFSAD